MSDEKHELLKSWIWLSNACGPGSDAYSKLLPNFDYDAGAVFSASRAELISGGASGALLERLCNKSDDEAEGIIKWCEEAQVRIITPLHRAYPRRLYAIQNKPLILYCRGTLPALDKYVCVAAVGTRDMTEYGRNNAYTLSYDLARAGAVVVSGMARGIDGMCHRGALDAGGFTVAVLGCGIDRIYPPEHDGLYNEIARAGLIITEYKPGTSPEGRNFPVRNRIISGLCNAVLVVECSRKSGAMLTASSATMQGRDIFALPGKVGEKNSEGVNELIAEGARIVTGANDILREYAPLYSDTIELGRIPVTRGLFPRKKARTGAELEAARNAGGYNAVEAPMAGYKPRPDARIKNAGDDIEDERRGTASFDVSGLTEIERRVYELIPSGKSVQADELAKSGIPMSEIMMALTMLEIKRGITFSGGGRYTKRD